MTDLKPCNCPKCGGAGFLPDLNVTGGGVACHACGGQGILYPAGWFAAAPKPDDGPVYLPKITEDLLDQWDQPIHLIEHAAESGYSPQWSQYAVDFAALLNQHRLPKPDELARLEREIAEAASMQVLRGQREGQVIHKKQWFRPPENLTVFERLCYEYRIKRGFLERHPEHPEWVRVKEGAL